MTLLVHLLATAATTLSGLGLLSILRWPGVGARSPGERIALGYFAGMIYVGLGSLLLASAGVRITTASLWLLQAPALALLLRDRNRRRARGKAPGSVPAREGRRRAGWEWVLLALIGAKLAWVLAMDLTDLFRTEDAFQCSLGLARHLHDRGTPADYGLLPPGYPRIPGVLLAWFGMCGGVWNEFGVNLAHWNYYAAFLLLFHENLRALAGRRPALVGTYLLSGFPLLLVHAVSAGYADLPLAIFVCFAGAYAYRYAREGSRDDLLLALFFAVSMPLIKMEGWSFLPLGFTAIGAAAAWRRGRPRPGVIWIAAGCLTLAALAGVVVLTRMYGMAGPPLLASQWGNLLPGNRLPLVAGPLGEHFGWFFNNWMLAGTLAALAFPALAIALARRAEYVLGLYGALLLAAFLYLYLVGGAYRWLVNGTVVNRSYMQIFPALLFGAVVMITFRAGRATAVPVTGEGDSPSRPAGHCEAPDPVIGCQTS